MNHEYLITLVRHGQVSLNRQNAFVGITDDVLTQEGIDQAHLIGQYLLKQKYQFDMEFCSPLLRCKQTAELVHQYIAVKINYRSELRERHYGIFEGKTPKEAETLDPILYARYVHDKVNTPLPEGESAIEIEERIHSFFWDIIPSQFPNVHNLLIITHLNPIRALLYLCGLKSRDIYHFKFFNSSITQIRTDLHESHLEIFNYSCFEDPTCLLDIPEKQKSLK